MAWASTMPGAIDALVTLLQQQAGQDPRLDGVQVQDGPLVGSQAVMEVLAVGYAGVDGEADADGQLSPEGLGTVQLREGYTVRCAAAVLVGGTDMAGPRRRAFEIAAAAGEVVAAYPTLGGAVMRASLGTVSLTQEQTSSGAQATVTFGVDCDAFTGR